MNEFKSLTKQLIEHRGKTLLNELFVPGAGIDISDEHRDLVEKIAALEVAWPETLTDAQRFIATLAYLITKQPDSAKYGNTLLQHFKTVIPEINKRLKAANWPFIIPFEYEERPAPPLKPSSRFTMRIDDVVKQGIEHIEKTGDNIKDRIYSLLKSPKIKYYGAVPKEIIYYMQKHFDVDEETTRQALHDMQQDGIIRRVRNSDVHYSDEALGKVFQPAQGFEPARRKSIFPSWFK